MGRLGSEILRWRLRPQCWLSLALGGGLAWEFRVEFGARSDAGAAGHARRWHLQGKDRSGAREVHRQGGAGLGRWVGRPRHFQVERVIQSPQGGSVTVAGGPEPVQNA